MKEYEHEAGMSAVRAAEESELRVASPGEPRGQLEKDLRSAWKPTGAQVGGKALAHHFNNLLTIIQANVALAQMGLPLGDPALEFLEQAAGSCQRAASVTTQLLALEESGAAMRTASMAQLVAEAAGFVCRETPVEIDLHIDPDLWTVAVYSEQIGRALHKILLDAVGTAAKGGPIEVSVANFTCGATTLPPLRAGRYVRTTIRVHRSGFDPGVPDPGFEPCFTTDETGDGLRLTMARTIFAAHQGHISVELKPHYGAGFALYLPALESVPGGSSLAPETLWRGTGRILVMDDQEPLRVLVKRLLEYLGYEVEMVEEGARAIAAFEKAKASGRGFHAALLDLEIPGGMGGLETALRLREVDSSIRLIATSGHTDALRMPNLQRHGFDDAVPKPWLPAQISEALHRALKQAAADAPHRSFDLASDRGPRGVYADAGVKPSGQRDGLSLSQRESEIVRLVAQGYRNKEIAAAMLITEQTVKNHLHNVFEKLRVSDRLELTLFAIKTGLYKSETESRS